MEGKKKIVKTAKNCFCSMHYAFRVKCVVRVVIVQNVTAVTKISIAIQKCVISVTIA